MGSRHHTCDALYLTDFERVIYLSEKELEELQDAEEADAIAAEHGADLDDEHCAET